MLTQYKRSWMPLIGFAAYAGLATTPAFAGGPHGLMRFVQVGEMQYSSSCERDGLEDRTSDACVSVEVVGADPEPAENAHSVYLIKLLEGSSQFRVRAQAAISLGMMDTSLAARRALTAALQDPHPAVRAAAATSLGRIGNAIHVSALRMLAGDPEEPVRNASRAAIGRLESQIEQLPKALEVATTAPLSATTNASRL